MTNFEKIKESTLEELVDILFKIGVDRRTSEDDDTCSCCEYYDEYYGCQNYDKWTNDICDPYGVQSKRSLIKSWLMED